MGIQAKFVGPIYNGETIISSGVEPTDYILHGIDVDGKVMSKRITLSEKPTEIPKEFMKNGIVRMTPVNPVSHCGSIVVDSPPYPLQCSSKNQEDIWRNDDSSN